jgi:hypothetical protein
MPRGRPSILTPELAAAICQTVRTGNSLKTAAITNGAGESTIHVWRNRGDTEEARLTQPGTRPRKEETLYRDFARELRAAQAEARKLHVDSVRLASVPHDETTTITKQVLNKDGEIVTLTETRTSRVFDWKASAFWLTHVARDEFTKAVEVAGPGGGPIQMEQTAPIQLDMSDAALEKWAEVVNRTFGDGTTPEGLDSAGTDNEVETT